MSGARPASILCAGMAVLDQVFRVDRMPAANEKVQAAAFLSVLGGCAANAAVAIARLGGQADLVAALGAPDDPVGRDITAALAREAVGHRGIVCVADASSTISSILVDAYGNRMIATRCDERLFAATVDDPPALVAGHDAVLVDNWLPDLVVPICAAARRRSMPLVVDGDGPMPADSDIVRLATHVVFAADALRATAHCDDLPQALLALRRHTGAFLAVTNGADDVLWLDDGTVRRIPVVPVSVVDTLAAGDVFHGAFALALAERQPEAEALRFAAACAAIKCARWGGGAGAPTRGEVEHVLGRGFAS